MPRVKRGTIHVKRRRNILKKTKGFKWGRKKLMRVASTAATKAGAHAYKGRKLKKRVNRRLWQMQVNAAVRELGLTYSKFIDRLKKNNVELDRKVLAEMANKAPKTFAEVVSKVK